MSLLDQIAQDLPFLTSLRHNLHAHPELGFEEERTSGIVATLLEEAGLTVHRGLGKTGVVGTLQVGNGTRRIGLRADMDALAMPEKGNRPYKSTIPGKMHACGHDGHTTMLIGAARHLAAKRGFSGTVHFIFQPAEEGRGGAKRMVEDGLFDLFPCDAVYGLHNMPGLDVDEMAVVEGRSWLLRIAGASPSGVPAPTVPSRISARTRSRRQRHSCLRCRPSSAVSSIRFSRPSLAPARCRRAIPRR